MADTVSVTQALNSPTPKIGEGKYAYAKMEHLPKMLRDQCRDALFFEAEPHVIADAWNIVRMAADELEARRASTQPAPAFPREEVAQAAYEGHVARNKPWSQVTLWEKERWRASADRIQSLLQGKQP